MGKTATNPATNDLIEFAKAHPVRSGLKCWVCTIPEHEAINEARKAGVRVPQIMQYLIIRRGYSDQEATRPKIDAHFKNAHHMKRAGK